MVDVAALQRENVELRAVVNKLTATIDTLTTQLAKMNERLAELLAVAQRRQGGSRTNASPPPPPGIRSVNPVEAVAPYLGSSPSRGGDGTENQARVGSVGAQV